MRTTTDPRVVAYLGRLDEAAIGLAPERRAELVAAAGDEPRSNEPGGHEPGPVPPGPAPLGPVPLGPAVPRGLGGLEAAALVLLLLGGFLVAIGWVVGVVLLWKSSRWSVGEKLLGTLVWPGGLATPVLFGGLVAFGAGGQTCVSSPASDGTVVEQCTGGEGNPVGIIFLVVTILAPVAVAIFLGIRASGRGGDAAAG